MAHPACTRARGRCPCPYTQSPNGFDKTGPYRARFILEALSDLRSRLRDAGSDLVVRIGKPGARPACLCLQCWTPPAQHSAVACGVPALRVERGAAA